MSKAKTGDTVHIHYTGTLTNGSEFDSSVGRDPLEFTIGAGQIISGLDSEVAGMAVGDTKTVTVPADEAYGPRNPEAVQEVPRSAVPENIDLVVGKQLQATTADGGNMVVTVAAISDDTVTMDANHPLAGEDLVFEVELVKIV